MESYDHEFNNEIKQEDEEENEFNEFTEEHQEIKEIELPSPEVNLKLTFLLNF